MDIYTIKLAEKDLQDLMNGDKVVFEYKNENGEAEIEIHLSKEEQA